MKEYEGYRQSLKFIRGNGYPALADMANGWTRAYGELGPEKKGKR